MTEHIMGDGTSMLSEEEIILLNALNYLSKREVIAVAGTCQRWRSIVRGPRFAALVRGLVEEHHPSLFEYSSTSSLNNAGWFDLFVRTDGLYVLQIMFLGRVMIYPRVNLMLPLLQERLQRLYQMNLVGLRNRCIMIGGQTGAESLNS